MIATPIKIDFSRIEGPVYTGRSRGEMLRNDYHLDDLDLEGREVCVNIPKNTYTISSSFFLGMFGPSVVKAGTKEKFYKQYHFDSPQFLKEVIDEYIFRALQKKNLFPDNAA